MLRTLAQMNLSLEARRIFKVFKCKHIFLRFDARCLTIRGLTNEVLNVTLKIFHQH